MLFGTFDYLHPGHIALFKQARKLAKNPYLIVSIARDKNVTKIKGQKAENTEKDRLSLVESCKLVDQVVLGAKDNFFKKILEINPSIIALGYDQKAYVEELKKRLKVQGSQIKVVRLKPYKKSVHKTSFKKQERKQNYER